MPSSQLVAINEPTGFDSCTIVMSQLYDNNVHSISLVNGQNIDVAVMKPAYFGGTLLSSYALGLWPDEPSYLKVYYCLANRIPVYSISEYLRSGRFVVIGCVVTTSYKNIYLYYIDTHFFRRGQNNTVEYWYPEFFIDISMIAMPEM